MKTTFLSKRLSLDAIIDYMIEINYLAVVFLVPIWFAFIYPTFNLFELNKIIIFRSLVWILLGLTTVRLLFFREGTIFAKENKDLFLKSWKKYFLFPSLLIFGLALTLIFSIDYQQSFFGSYDRQQGLSSQIFYFLWALLVFVNITSHSKHVVSPAYKMIKIRRVLVVAILSATIVSIYGILQIFNIDFLNWPEPPYLTGRTISSLGQPNFLASFLLLTIPLGFYFIFLSRKFLIKFLFALAIFLQIICFFFTSSRGGLVALLLTTGVLLAYIFFVSSINQKTKIKIILVLAGLSLIGFVSLETLTPGRIKYSFDMSGGSFAARVNFFQSAADAIIQKPFFGYGLENSGEVFVKYYERDWGIYGDVGSNTDRAHNLFLDIILNVGFFGLILFTLWYYSVFKIAFTNIRAKKDDHLSLILIFGIIAYLLSLLFSFAVVITEIYFWLFFALLAIVNFNQTAIMIPSEYQLKADNKKLKSALAVAVFLVITWQLSLNLKSLMADSYLNDIYLALGDGKQLEATVFHDYIKALKVNPVQMEFYNHFTGDNLSNQYSYAADLSTKEIIKNKLEEILHDLPDAGYKNVLLKGTINSTLGNYSEADKYFDRMVILAPHWPVGYLERAQDFLRRGDIKNAEIASQSVEVNLPDLNDSRLNEQHRKSVASYKYLIYVSLGDIYFSRGGYQEAEKFFQAAYRSKPEDYSLMKKIADTYYLRGDLTTALKYVLRGAAFNPSDYNWQVALASLYFEAGDKTEALKYIDEAIKLAPDKQNLQELRLKYKN